MIEWEDGNYVKKTYKVPYRQRVMAECGGCDDGKKKPRLLFTKFHLHSSDNQQRRRNIFFCMFRWNHTIYIGYDVDTMKA